MFNRKSAIEIQIIIIIKTMECKCPGMRLFRHCWISTKDKSGWVLYVCVVQTPSPPKTPSDESINRGLVCAHMHFIARTQKILTFVS